MRGARNVALGGAVALAALLPLYGSTTPGSAVTHPEWARMILHGLDLLEGGGATVTDTAAHAFAALSGRDSRAWPAERYLSGRNVELVAEDGERRLVPTDVVGEAVYGMAVTRPGDYRLRLRVSSPSPVEAELGPMGTDEIARSFVVPAGPMMSWVDAGVVHLDPGAYDASVLLPEGASLDFVELAPPCVHPIEPPGGWQPTAITTSEDVAVTLLQALDMEHELPPAAAALEYRGSDLVLENGTRAGEAAAGEAGSGTFRGGPRGARVVLTAEIPQAGLYTLSVFGQAGGGQRWLADGCRKQVVCPATTAVSSWRVVLSGYFGSGPHLFAASLGPDTVVERIRFEQKKDSADDYVAAVERLGFALPPGTEVTRDQAEEARRFLRRRLTQAASELCGDILAPGTLVAELASAGAGTGTGGEGATGGGEGGGEGGSGGGGGGGGPVPPPVIPPLPPGSPTLPVGFGG